MFFVMAIAGMVCTALSVSGQTITDLKTGYWLGSTPAAQEKVKFLGIAASAAGRRRSPSCCWRGRSSSARRRRATSRPVLASPQASIMKALVEGFMSRQPVAYILFGAGAMIAVIMEMLGVPALDLRARHVPAAGAEHAGAGGRLPRLPDRPALRTHRRRARARDPRARRRHRLGPDGRRRAGRRLRRGAAPLARLLGGLDQDAVLRQRRRSPQTVSALLFVALCLYVWRGSLGRAKED